MHLGREQVNYHFGRIIRLDLRSIDAKVGCEWLFILRIDAVQAVQCARLRSSVKAFWVTFRTKLDGRRLGRFEPRCLT